MSIHIKEAYPRIEDALDSGKTVILTDGTFSAKVTKVFGDADDITEKYLTLAMDGYATKSFEVNTQGVLEGITLRDTYTELFIGPDLYLSDWPCPQSECIARVNGFCSVSNCKGIYVRPGRKFDSAKDAAKAYHLFLEQEEDNV